MNCEFVQSLTRLFFIAKISEERNLQLWKRLLRQQCNRKIEHQLDTAQAVTDCKIDELTREVREHNNFARRVPVVEEQIKVINHRIADLEQKG